MKERAARIQQLISESGKTYQELEKLTGIKKSSLQRYASGVTEKIPLTAVEKLAVAFSVPEAYIMWGQTKNPTTENDSGISKPKQDLIKKVMQMSDEELLKLDLLLRIVESK